MIKRPLCIATVCYIIGIIMGLYLKISIVFLLCFFTLTILLICSVFHKKNLIIFFIIILCGHFSIQFLDRSYEKEYQFFKEGKEYEIEGVIVSEPIEEEYKIVCEVEIRQINGDTIHSGKRWLLNVKKKKDNQLQHHDEQIQFGDLIAFNGSIEIPSKARNNMGFDYQKYLKVQKIYGTLVVKNQIQIAKKNQSSVIARVLYNVKQDIRERIYFFLPQGIRELCLGILIGNRKEISQDVINEFNKSNLSHMLAVSGAHVSYITLILNFLFHKTRYRLRKAFIGTFLIFFMGLTGFTPSVERAGLMVILTMLAGVLYRKQDVYTNLFFSCLVILFINPYAIFDIGFQLSYGGTLGILLFQKKISKLLFQCFVFERVRYDTSDINTSLDRKKQKEKWTPRIKKYVIDALAVSISANLVIIPIMGVWFHNLSFTFWISNLLAGPLLGVITVGGFILYATSLLFTPIANLVSWGLKYLLYLLIFIARICSNIPFSSILVRTPYWFEILFYYFLLFVINYFPYFKKKILKLSCILLVCMIACYSIIEITSFGHLQIYFVDVGQGDCTLIHTPRNQTILIDGGGSEVGDFDVGERILLPYLLNRRITKIDYIIISHFDTDHVGRIVLYYETNKSKKCDYRKAI